MSSAAVSTAAAASAAAASAAVSSAALSSAAVSSEAVSSAALAFDLSPAGSGAASGSGFLAASLIDTQPPLAPGTAPLTMISPRSTSVRTTCRFCVVTRAAPMCPAIFLPLNTLPGSWHWPVEPCERWLIDTPCEARSPWKLCRFMAPAKPLPIETPETSTNCPSA